MEKIRLLLADDHKMVREGLKAFFAPNEDFEVVAEAVDGLEAVEKSIQLKPDIILLDLMMPNMNGVEAATQIKMKFPEARIIIITSSLEETQVIAAIKAGASGYLLKDSSPDEIEDAIKKVHRGETAFPSRITSIMVKELNKPQKSESKCASLTEREVDILKLVAAGHSNQEIADRLFLSVWTVRTYVTGILEKLGVENRTQATLYALREGLVSLED